MREAHGVAAERLIFAPELAPGRSIWRGWRWPICSWMACPTTPTPPASDALWAGVPLLTCRGNAFPGRVAASLLGAWPAGTDHRIGGL